MRYRYRQALETAGLHDTPSGGGSRRRDLLMGAGAGALGLLAASALAPTAAVAGTADIRPPAANSVLGMWMEDVKFPAFPASGAPVAGCIELAVWGAGGAFIVNGQLSDRVDLGTWEMIDPVHYRYVLVTLLFDNQDFASSQYTSPPTYRGSVVGAGQITLTSPTTYTGREDFTVYDSCNNVAAANYTLINATKVPMTGFTPTLSPGATCPS